MRPKSAGNIRPLTPWRRLNSSAFCGLIAAFEDYALYWLWLTIRRGIAVGYMTDGMASSTSENKYNMMSVPFEAVDGKGISLNAINFAGATYALASGSADIVMFWKPDVQNYEQYYYYGFPGYEEQLPPCWKNIDGNANYDADHPEGIAAGTVFWYYSFRTATTVNQEMTSSGAVPAESYQTFTINHKVGENTYYFVANPYPANANLAYKDGDVDWGKATYALASGSADIMMIWDAATQNYVQYYFYGFPGYEAQLTPEWKNVDGNSPFSTDYPNGLPAGTGFWYLAYQATGSAVEQTITFNSPLAK